jgi:hypothetical protein
VLRTRGTLGKGTLRMYPSLRVPTIGMEYRMKIEQNGGKLQKLGGYMTLTLYVGLYQEKPGMTNQPALTQNYPGRPD